MLLGLIDDDILFKQLGPQAGPLKQIFHNILGVPRNRTSVHSRVRVLVSALEPILVLNEYVPHEYS